MTEREMRDRAKILLVKTKLAKEEGEPRNMDKALAEAVAFFRELVKV
jgi:hypothetical protein